MDVDSPFPAPSSAEDQETQLSIANRQYGQLQHYRPAPQAPRIPISMIPTLLPPQIAHVVTALSFTARISMRATAFLIECMLESTRYGAQAYLGITRRMLIAAVSSARRVYLLSNAATNGGMTGLIGQASDQSDDDENGSFFQILDRYTNLGIYVIHHTFTLAELFTMSGFYLTSATVKSAKTAAEESVNVFDGIFGSNETSRALSSIITLVRKELLSDERFEAANKSKVASLTALTKALTAFACLQNATQRRLAGRHKLRVLYDCTVFGEKTDSHGKATRTAGFVPPPIESAPTPAEAGPGPSTQASRDQQLKASSTPSGDEDSAKWERDLGKLVNDSGDELADAGVGIRRNIKRVDDAVYQIVEEVEQTTTVTQIMDQLGPQLAHAARKQSEVYLSGEPEVTVEIQEGPTLHEGDVRRDGLVEEEDDWIEVNNLLDDNKFTTTNGQTASRDQQKLQLVLRTITKKLRERKRTIRRLPDDGMSQAERGQVKPLEWTERSRGTSVSSGSSSPPGSLLSASDKSRALPQVSIISAVGNGLGGGPHLSPTPRDIPKASRQRLYSARQSSPSQAGSTPSLGSSSASSPTSATSARALHSRSELRKSRAHTSHREKDTKRRKRSTESTQSNAIHGAQTPPGRMPPAPPSSPESAKAGRRDSIKTSVKSLKADQQGNAGRSVHTITNNVESTSRETGPNASDSQPEDLFPHDHLVRNIHRFMRYSSAAYGQNFLRILGLGNSDFNFPTTGKYHANSWAFAQHTNLPIDALLLSSFTEPNRSFAYKKAPPLVHYIAVDHGVKAIVLTCRGTLGLQDVLVDLTCDYLDITVEGGKTDDRYFVHSGMYHSALQLTERQSTVHQTLIDALKRYPEYGLVLCGHSLGGGVAALLAVLCATPVDVFQKQKQSHIEVTHPAISTPFVTSFSSGLPPGRPIHCYSYGPPAVASSDLARYARGLITSVVQGSDVVPTLSLGVLRDLRNISVTLFEEGRVAEEIVGRVVGVYQRKFEFQNRPGIQPGVSATSQEINAGHTRNHATDAGYCDPSMAVANVAEPDDEQVLSDWMLSLIKTMRADMDNDKLYPPGKIYIMEYFAVYVTGEGVATSEGGANGKQAHRVILRQCDSVEERFGEPLFSKSMLNDHLPSHYERSSQLLFEGLGQDKL